MTFSGRFVSSSQSRFGVASIRSQRRRRASTTSGWSSNTSAIDAQNTRGRHPSRAASRFHFNGFRQFASDIIFRGECLPQMS